MESESSGVTSYGGESRILGLGWEASFMLGVITLILGLVIAFYPSQSLIAIAVLLGIVMIISGIYHIARALGAREHERVWRGIAGVLFLLAGLVLLRHLHLTVALIGIFVGFTWIVQGVMMLMEAFSGLTGRSRGWSVAFGIISLIAGIVVVTAPIASVGVLTIFLGIWFVVMGACEVIGSLITRHDLRRLATTEGVRVPGQRAAAAEAGGQAAPAAKGTTGDSQSTGHNIPG
jgi:uncharacterized membrane protein HdeD (DUF308 family)